MDIPPRRAENVPVATPGSGNLAARKVLKAAVNNGDVAMANEVSIDKDGKQDD